MEVDLEKNRPLTMWGLAKFNLKLKFSEVL
jgi:hypothetical protein